MMNLLYLLALCLYSAYCHQANPEIGLTEAEKVKFLDVHNEYRRKQESSNMYELEWDDHLAIIAWRWAEHCNFTHGQINNDYGSDIGQNLYIKEGETNKYGGLYSWLYESAYYDYDTGACSRPPCGHYTQANWGSSYRMGCAYSRCPKLYWPEQNKYLTDAHNIVCHYWPAGNLVGAKPFKKGPACSECDNGKGWCKDGLCQSFCDKKGPGCACSNNLNCSNCGETNSETCSCKCAKGFRGTWCKDVCRDLDERCPSFQQVHCENPKFGATIKTLCPLACGLCEYQEDKSWTCQGKTWEDVFGVVDGE